eukprot:CAMPEP_0170466032 /NCGR_PEP_ID=MMETSP0123-20130129/10157_1 /TAXON_ID=182087 /ORGANISM="Favella ehrenbergii, Strain Fehren 1" /LENGTH=111 /DNA_ID=CAMNT_0010732085 /DNA_START=99 /DNA_END=435 /DNA_ORIENTATION=+
MSDASDEEQELSVQQPALHQRQSAAASKDLELFTLDEAFKSALCPKVVDVNVLPKGRKPINLEAFTPALSGASSVLKRKWQTLRISRSTDGAAFARGCLSMNNALESGARK